MKATKFGCLLVALAMAVTATAKNGKEETAEIVFVADGWSSSRFVSAAMGGVVEIEGVARLTIPGGALPRDGVVSMLAEVVVMNGERFVVVHFGPHGMTFTKSATLELWPRMIRKAGGAPRLYYNTGVADDGSLSWMDLGVSEDSDANGEGVFRTSIDHFSTYGVGYDFLNYSWKYQWSFFSYSYY